VAAIITDEGGASQGKGKGEPKGQGRDGKGSGNHRQYAVGMAMGGPWEREQLKKKAPLEQREA